MPLLTTPTSPSMDTTYELGLKFQVGPSGQVIDIRDLVLVPATSELETLELAINVSGMSFSGVTMATLQDSQKVNIKLQARSAAGNSTTMPTGMKPLWTSTDPTVMTVAVAADGLSADVITSGKLGTAVLKITNTATLSVIPLTVQVVAGPAASLTMIVGVPTP